MKKVIKVLAIVCFCTIALFVYAIGQAGEACGPGGECEDGLECNQEHNICVQIGAALCFENGIYSHGCIHSEDTCPCGSATVLDARMVY